ncbi:MAG: ribosome biogenesis GTPase Der [bacterium]
MDKKPLIIVVGRQNVGKSTLFNKLIGQRLAIVDKTPGITRDFNSMEIEWLNKKYDIVDTGGVFGYDAVTGLMDKIEQQVYSLFDEADLILFLVDGKEGLTPGDQEIGDILRKVETPVVTVVNKLDHSDLFPSASNYFCLGFGNPIPISAAQGLGIGDLLDEIDSRLDGIENIIPRDQIFISIAGRPNVGKSSLLNAICGKNRALVHAQPGTTRDPVKQQVIYKNKTVNIVDTAGYRRISRLENRIEYYSLTRAWNTFSESSICIVVIDASMGFTRGDWRVLKEVEYRSGGVLLVINKIDLVPAEMRDQLIKKVATELKSHAYIPIATTSALEKRGITGLLDKVLDIYRRGSRRISKKDINNYFKQAVINHLPPLYGKKRVKFSQFTLIKQLPHIIIAKCNHPRGVGQNYLKYLEKNFRDDYELEGVIVKIRPRS